jgi:hypothetical protein
MLMGSASGGGGMSFAGWSAYFAVIGADTPEEVLYSLPPTGTKLSDWVTLIDDMNDMNTAPPVGGPGGVAALQDQAHIWLWGWAKTLAVSVSPSDTVEQWVASGYLNKVKGWTDGGPILPSASPEVYYGDVPIKGCSQQQADLTESPAGTTRFGSDWPVSAYFQTGSATTSVMVQVEFDL